MGRRKKPEPASREHPRLVAEKKCSECLFSPNRVVDTDRASQIIKQVGEKHKYFECHKGSIAGCTVVCHGSWLYHFDAQSRELLKALEWVKMIDADALLKDG